MKRLVILTGSELRHTFFRQWLAQTPGVEVVHSYCEGLERSVQTLVAEQSDNRWRTLHLQCREQSERDFFGLFVNQAPDLSRPVFIHKGEINAPASVESVLHSQPDLLVAYGCSLIHEPLLSAFQGRFINIHLGLSPYYRGSGTNFWPLVNREPEYVGATFMHIDVGVDTGAIIHQIRARLVWGDTPATIGNRLILDMAVICRALLLQAAPLPAISFPSPSANTKYYKKKDFTEAAVATLYQNFRDGLVEQYLATATERCRKVPLVQHLVLAGIELL